MATKAQRFQAEGTMQILLLDPDNVWIIGYDTEDGPEHFLYDRRAKKDLDEALVENMLQEDEAGVARGVQETCEIRLVVHPEKGEIVCVEDGRQRTKALREANKRRQKAGKEKLLLKCIPKEGSEQQALRDLAATFLRTDDTVVGKAEKAKRLLDGGDSVDSVARTMGCSDTTIRNYTQLLKCSPYVQKLVDEGELPMTVAKKLHKLGWDEQDAIVKEMLATGNVRGQAAQEKAREKAENGSTEPNGDGDGDGGSKKKGGRSRKLKARTTKAILAAADKVKGEKAAKYGLVHAMLRWSVGDKKPLRTDYPEILEKLEAEAVEAEA